MKVEDRVSALGWRLGLGKEDIEAICQKTGLAKDQLLSQPLSKRGFGGIEMLGWLSAHQCPDNYWDTVLLPEFRGNWTFFSGHIRGHFESGFLEWWGSPRRKLEFFVLAFRYKEHWLKMFSQSRGAYVSRMNPAEWIRRLLYAALSRTQK